MTPQQQLAQLRSEAESLSTPYNDGNLEWLRWQGSDDARPLVLLHGGFGSWTHWVHNISALCGSRTLLAVDMPGLGDSADMRPSGTLEHFAGSILESFDELYGPDAAFDLLGFSFGALVGAEMATLAAHRCRHFIACGAAGFGDLHVQVDLLRPPGKNVSPEDAAAIHRQNLRTLMFSPDYPVDDLAVTVHGDNLARARFNSRGLARGDGFITAIPRIEARLCGIWGDLDATAGGEQAILQRRDLFQATQPDCAFHVLEGIGHWAMYEAADTFNRLVIAELDREPQLRGAV